MPRNNGAGRVFDGGTSVLCRIEGMLRTSPGSAKREWQMLDLGCGAGRDAMWVVGRRETAFAPWNVVGLDQDDGARRDAKKGQSVRAPSRPRSCALLPTPGQGKSRGLHRAPPFSKPNFVRPLLFASGYCMTCADTPERGSARPLCVHRTVGAVVRKPGGLLTPPADGSGSAHDRFWRMAENYGVREHVKFAQVKFRPNGHSTFLNVGDFAGSSAQLARLIGEAAPEDFADQSPVKPEVRPLGGSSRESVPV